MNNKIRTDAVDHLFDAILTLNDKEELYTFFEDVCTVNELLSLSQRYEVAKMLREKITATTVMTWSLKDSVFLKRIPQNKSEFFSDFFISVQALSLPAHPPNRCTYLRNAPLPL